MCTQGSDCVGVKPTVGAAVLVALYRGLSQAVEATFQLVDGGNEACAQALRVTRPFARTSVSLFLGDTPGESVLESIKHQSANTTSWKRPEASPEELANLQAAGKAGEPQANRKEDGGDAQTGKADGGQPSPLPAGWVEIKDPTSGGVYFWNQVRRRKISTLSDIAVREARFSVSGAPARA